MIADPILRHPPKSPAGRVCLLSVIKPFVEESEPFPRLKQLQIAGVTPGNIESRCGAEEEEEEEGEGLSRSTENPTERERESINPSPLVRSEISLQMFQDVWPK